MENITCRLLSAFLYVFTFTRALLSNIIYKERNLKTHPPGPKPWPVIGNLNLLGSIPHQSLHLLSQEYGELMQLKFGKYPVVVVSSPKMAKQFLRTQDAVFSSRPALAAGKYISCNYSDVGWAPYGPHWQQARKILINEFLSAKKLESFDHIRVAERRDLISHLHTLSGKPIVLGDHLSRYTLSTICRMALGDKYFTESENDESIIHRDELKRMVRQWFFLHGVFNIGDWIPWLSFLDMQGYVNEMKALHKKFDRFFDYVIDDHRARRAAGKDCVAKDLVDVLLQMVEDPNLEVKLTRDCIKGILQDTLAGGTDTTVTVVEWAIQEIINQPLMMLKAKEELDRVIGRNRWVEENDFSQLPYIDAIIMESMRLHPVGALFAPHYATEDCKVVGYDISKGTTVLINIWSIGRNPNSWDAPLEFLPERFLGKGTDMLGSNFAMLPFGSGRRRCPGYNIGLKFVRTMLANLLHGFELKLGPKDVCMEEEYGLATHPKVPVSIILKPTLPSHLY